MNTINTGLMNILDTTAFAVDGTQSYETAFPGAYLYARILKKANAQLGQANSFPDRLYRAADWLDQHERDNMTLDGYFKWLKARDTSRKTWRPKRRMRSNSDDDDSG
jgi:hypothetical protein